MSELKAIIHIDEMNKWKLVLANTRNLIEVLKGQSLTVEVLANSEAVQYLIQSNNDDESSRPLRILADEKVLFAVCNNSLRGLDIDPKSLFDFVTVVPSGVVELTLKQHEGYAYIKP